MQLITRGNSGPYLVGLHGIQATNRSWLGVADLLKPDFRVVLPNLRGRDGDETFAQSADFSLDGYVEDLKRLLDEFAEPIWLAGWSMGVSVILQYVSKYGTAGMHGLILISGSPAAGFTQWFKGQSIDALVAEAEDRQQRLGLAEAAIPLAVAKTWLALRDVDHRAVLSSIDKPVLVLHGGEDDQCPPNDARQMASAIANAQITVYPSVGHNMLKQRPDELVQAIKQFCDADAPAASF